MIRIYASPRGMPLVYNGSSIDCEPILTVENYCKWYELFLIKTANCILSVGFNRLERWATNCESPYRDHVPNPNCVIRLAKANKWFLCPESLDMIIGRWHSGDYTDD